MTILRSHQSPDQPLRTVTDLVFIPANDGLQFATYRLDVELPESARAEGPAPWRDCEPVRTAPRSTIMLDRIRIDPQVCEGKPTIRGMRITVDFVLKLIGDGYTADDIVREYPELEKEDVYQAAKYGAWLASEKTTAIA